VQSYKRMAENRSVSACRRTCHIVWSEARELILVTYVLEHCAHKKTMKSKKDKWIAVTRALALHIQFEGCITEVDPKALSLVEKKWGQMKVDCTFKYGLEDGANNISGDVVFASVGEQMIYNMIVDLMAIEEKDR